MANYQLLKADIDAKVYQNGEQEITGANLNSVLNAMVTTLGAEYQFAGVATTTTNPGTPDAKVFYIANGKGTYTNFGSLEVTEDEVIVLYWDTAWHKEATGIASQEKLTELESNTNSKLTDLQRAFAIAWFENYTDVPNDGGFIGTNGDVIPFADARYTDYISISPGKTYFIKKPFIIDSAILAIYDGDKKLIRTIDSSALSDGNLTFIANENEYYIRVSFNGEDVFPKYISLQNEGIAEQFHSNSVTTIKIQDDAVTLPKLSDSVKDIFSVANPITIENTELGYINENGNLTSFAGSRATDYLPVKKGVPVVLLNPFVVDASIIALYDKTKTVTRIIRDSEIGVEPKIAIIIPNENDSYLRVSFLTRKIPNVIYYAMDKSTFDSSVFDVYNVIDGGYINAEGNVVDFPGGNFAYTDYIELPQGIKFKIVNKTIDSASFAIYTYDKTVSRVILSSDIIGKEFIEFVLSGDEKFIRATLRTGDFCNIYFNEIITKCDILKSVVTAQAQNEKQYNVLAAFNNIVCVGDSLTYSQVYTALSASRQAHRPYPTVLGKLCGNDATILARSGATAQTCWNEFGSQIVAKTNPLAIIYLGTNNGLTDTLDTDVVGNDPVNWADNNIGCYCRFVQKFQSLGYKVLLLKCWTTSGTGDSDLTHTNSAINHIATRFGCSVMDVPVSANLKYHYYPDLSGYNGVHYNDLGYSWFASQLIQKIGQLPVEQMKWIIPNA